MSRVAEDDLDGLVFRLPPPGCLLELKQCLGELGTGKSSAT